MNFWLSVPRVPTIICVRSTPFCALILVFTCVEELGSSRGLDLSVFLARFSFSRIIVLLLHAFVVTALVAVFYPLLNLLLLMFIFNFTLHVFICLVLLFKSPFTCPKQVHRPRSSVMSVDRTKAGPRVVQAL